MIRIFFRKIWCQVKSYHYNCPLPSTFPIVKRKIKIKRSLHLTFEHALDHLEILVTVEFGGKDLSLVMDEQLIVTVFVIFIVM